MPDLKLQKFFPLVKVDEATRMVYGLVTAESKDKDGETCDYASTKPEYEKVNAELGKASGGENIMPLREMHQLNAVGAGKSIEFDDARKQIRMAFKVVDDSAWKKVCEKVLIGFSQGGRYLKQWTANGVNYYTAQPGEVSLVDNPCLPGAFIEYAKADGSIELFKTRGPSDLSSEDLQKLIDGLSASLGTQLEKISNEAKKVKQDIATGADMKPEQIKKCAEALGITEAEFTKQFIEGDALEKGKKGLAALHAHLKKAMATHEKLMSMHKAMGEHHAAMGEHMDNCMKAHGACMDGEEAEKILKAAGVTLAKPNPTNADLEKTVSEAVAKATKELQDKVTKLEAEPAPPKGQLFRVSREEMDKATKDQVANDPIPTL